MDSTAPDSFRRDARVIATSAIAGYLPGGTAGNVARGALAARTGRHDVVASTRLLAGASLLVSIAG